MYGEDLPAIERMILDLLAEKRVGRPDWMQIYLYGVSCSSWLWAFSPRFGSRCDVILLGGVLQTVSSIDLAASGCTKGSNAMQCDATQCGGG
jgi:hypothetical protein